MTTTTQLLQQQKLLLGQLSSSSTSLLRDVLFFRSIRTAHELLAGMSNDDVSNTAIVELSTRSANTVADLHRKGGSDDDLAGMLCLEQALLLGGYRTAAELKTMSVDDWRNTLIVELASLTSLPVSKLQGMRNVELARQASEPSMRKQYAPLLNFLERHDGGDQQQQQQQQLQPHSHAHLLRRAGVCTSNAGNSMDCASFLAVPEKGIQVALYHILSGDDLFHLELAVRRTNFFATAPQQSTTFSSSSCAAAAGLEWKRVGRLQLNPLSSSGQKEPEGVGFSQGQLYRPFSSSSSNNSGGPVLLLAEISERSCRHPRIFLRWYPSVDALIDSFAGGGGEGGSEKCTAGGSAVLSPQRTLLLGCPWASTAEGTPSLIEAEGSSPDACVLTIMFHTYVMDGENRTDRPAIGVLTTTTAAAEAGAASAFSGINNKFDFRWTASPLLSTVLGIAASCGLQGKQFGKIGGRVHIRPLTHSAHKGARGLMLIEGQWTNEDWRSWNIFLTDGIFAVPLRLTGFFCAAANPQLALHSVGSSGSGNSKNIFLATGSMFIPCEAVNPSAPGGAPGCFMFEGVIEM